MKIKINKPLHSSANSLIHIYYIFSNVLLVKWLKYKWCDTLWDLSQSPNTTCTTNKCYTLQSYDEDA